ncbi:MAG: replicative DNA helicase [Pseudomonadota bacterium]
MAQSIALASTGTPAKRANEEGMSEGRTLPHNLEAEQALLGALLINNSINDQISFLLPEHFYDPVHGRIFDTARRRIMGGHLATPITLKTLMEQDPGLQELGGARYLAGLTESAIAIFTAKDYAQEIYNLALRRELARIGEVISHEALDGADERDPTTQIAAAEERLYKLAEAGQVEGGFVSFDKALFEAVETANKAYQRDRDLVGISTGLIDLDHKLGGLHESDLLILAGRPSMGKTALVTNIAFNVANAYREGRDDNGRRVALDGGVVGFFSLEMSAEQLATRILAEQAEIESDKLRRGDMNEEEFRRFALTAQALEKAPLFIDDTPALSIGALAARARRLARKPGLDLLIVDYLQLCRGNGGRSDANRVQEVSEITQGLKAIAKELNIPVIALSQLSRQVEQRDDKRPQLSDLRESGSIEQDADAVMFVFREEYYVGRQEPTEGTPEHATWMEKMSAVHNLAEVVIGKQRHGPIGTVKLMFDSRYTRFGDLARGATSGGDHYE